jgi:hypothetical protein
MVKKNTRVSTPPQAHSNNTHASIINISSFHNSCSNRRVFNASKQHVPCLAHVLNLAVQALLGKDGLGARAPADAEALDVEEDEEDDSEGLIRTSICVDADDSDEDEEPDLQETVETVANAAVEHVDVTRRTQRALVKLRKGIVKIR